MVQQELNEKEGCLLLLSMVTWPDILNHDLIGRLHDTPEPELQISPLRTITLHYQHHLSFTNQGTHSGAEVSLTRGIDLSDAIVSKGHLQKAHIESAHPLQSNL